MIAVIIRKIIIPLLLFLSMVSHSLGQTIAGIEFDLNIPSSGLDVRSNLKLICLPSSNTIIKSLNK